MDATSSLASIGVDSLTFFTAEVIPSNDMAVERGILCSHHQTALFSTSENWTEEIKKANALFGQHYKSGDFTAISNLYTEDCKVMPPGAKLGEGRKAVEQIFSCLPEAGVDNVTLTSAEVIISNNDTAVERGNYVLSRSDGSVFDQGKFVVVWKKVDGGLRMYTDIWNSDSSS